MGELKWWHARRGPPLLLLPAFPCARQRAATGMTCSTENMRNPANTVAMTTQPEDNCFTAHNTTHHLGCFRRMILLLFFCSMKQRRVALFMVIRIFCALFIFWQLPVRELPFYPAGATAAKKRGKHKWAVLLFGCVWNKWKLSGNVTSALEMPLVLRGVVLLAASSLHSLT